MSSRALVFQSLVVGFLMAGCARITSQVVEKPRVDQEMEGNRGYLVGSAPASEARKPTRQMVQTDVELATWAEMLPWKKRKLASQTPAASPVPARPATPPSPEVNPPSAEIWEPEPEEFEAAAPSASEAPAASPYTVQRGDTLEKIAAKVYGDGNQWRRIYQANRDKLSSPNRIYPGQKLTIPSAQEEGTQRDESSSDLK